MRGAAVGALLLGGAVLACSDALDQGTTAGQSVVVVHSASNDVMLLEVTRLLSSSFQRAPGIATSVAARGGDLIIALGDINAIQLATTTAAGTVIPLAPGSGPTAVAIEDDSIVWVATPALNRIARVNYRSGDTGSVAAGVYPQGVLFVEDTLLIINGNLTGGVPAGASWITVLPGGDSIALTGQNARYAALGLDGFVYVVTSGRPGAADGRLSIVDLQARREVAVINGLGEFPGPAVYHPSGRLLIASATEGILEVRTSTRSLERGPGAGIKPLGDGVTAVVVDAGGRVYAVSGNGCQEPGTLHVLDAPPDYRVVESLSVALCPSAAVLAGVN
jgi:hypothetical protein